LSEQRILVRKKGAGPQVLYQSQGGLHLRLGCRPQG
jgi:hypothetical protein